MRLKLLSILAASLLAAACSTTPENTGDASGAGGAGSSSSTGSGASADASAGSAGESGPSYIAGSQEALVAEAGDRVFFGFDKADLTAEARETLRRQAAWMRVNPSVVVIVEGHADERGTRDYNLALGERRASAVRDYLVALGVDANRIRTISYGKERPAVLGSNDAAWTANRRSVTMVNTSS